MSGYVLTVFTLRHHTPKSTTKEPRKFFISSGIRGSQFLLFVNIFFGSAVRDIPLQSRWWKNIHFSYLVICTALLGVKVLGKVLV